MEISFLSFWGEITASPVLAITVLLTLGVIFVNGWTDAPNAIALVSLQMYGSPVCNLDERSVQLSGSICHDADQQLCRIDDQQHVDFGTNTQEAMIALCAALLSIVVYSVAASFFGIPTSESHSLIAGLSGAAIAIQHGIGGINGSEWVKVLYGLVLSLALGFLSGWVICKILALICYGLDRVKANRFFAGAQIASAAGMSFMHGAQDGQKFIGVLFLDSPFPTGRILSAVCRSLYG